MDTLFITLVLLGMLIWALFPPAVTPPPPSLPVVYIQPAQAQPRQGSGCLTWLLIGFMVLVVLRAAAMV